VALFFAIRNFIALGILWMIISYDIACRFRTRFLQRVLGAPRPLFQEKDRETLERITWLVPKFHLGGHQPSCSDNHSFNYTPGVGRNHGEGVESIWSTLNWLKYSTREMGPGHRIEVLTDNMQAINWSKIRNIGEPVRPFPLRRMGCLN
jgi:hypothetical protein